MRNWVPATIAIVFTITMAACGGGGGGNNNATVTVSPSTATVAPGATQQFSATVTNTTNTAVNWQVNGVGGGNSAVGTIDGTGLYTAPAVTPSPSNVTITAVLQANSNISGSATVTIAPLTPTVTVTPATVTVQEGAKQQFTATVTNTPNTAVTWQVNGVTGGSSSTGTIDTTGLYTAPAIVPNPASVTITAVLQADTSISGSAIATIGATQFNNASLKGNYVFSLSGIDTGGGVFYAVGVITTDGNGNVTGGEEDLNDFSVGYVTTNSITGTYSVGADGRGTLNLNSGIGSFSYAIAIKALNNADLNEIDNNVVTATGNLDQQAAGTGSPSGNYAFGFAGQGLGCGSFNSIGIMSFSNTRVGGIQDLNCGGSITQNQTLAGSYNTIDSLGRGTGQLAASTGTSDIVYYVVSGNRLRFLCIDSATFFLGSADLQTQSSFAGSDFAGSYVVSTGANTQAGVSYTLIQLNASNGNISSGFYDVNDTGAVGSSAVTGAYGLTSNGRVSGSFSVSGATLPFSMYLISPTQGYYLDQRTNAVGGGNIYAQNAAVTSNAAWAGSYATKQYGYFVSNGGVQPANSSGVSGQLSADGKGNLAGTLDINDPNGVFPNATLQGTYSVGTTAPGRTTVTITTSAEGTRSYIGYIVDGTRVLLLETDNNLVSSGDAIRQF